MRDEDRNGNDTIQSEYESGSQLLNLTEGDTIQDAEENFAAVMNEIEKEGEGGEDLGEGATRQVGSFFQNLNLHQVRQTVLAETKPMIMKEIEEDARGEVLADDENKKSNAKNLGKMIKQDTL